MKNNKLQLNADKTEFILITPSRQSSKVTVDNVSVGNCDVPVASTARNLGATFDCHMTLQPHVSSIVKSCYWQLRRIGQLRKYLNKEAAERIIHAFISSRLDKGNALLFGLPDNQIDRLQRIHNTAARILTMSKKFDHITPILAGLHWLPVKQRIVYKLMVLTYRCLHGLAPIYLSDLISAYQPSRLLRSCDSFLLKVPLDKQKDIQR